jgi:DNA-directed RNA polymerase subunit RPC12/RpoP
MADEMIIDTSGSAKDGQNKCPKCGATDISLNESTGELRCNFCRYVFKPEILEGMQDGVGNLSGEQLGSGATDIDNSAESMVTLKCSSCGAEVVINLDDTAQARCHWCRNILSINSKVPNGTVPDALLPFNMKKEEAKGLIEAYVAKHKFFANKVFKREFTTENVMGVYFPYMIVDMKGHAVFKGIGEHEQSKHSVTRGTGDHKHTETIYTVESYDVTRECDVEIDDLTVESSAKRAGASQKHETNNIINAILPFDTENCVKFDANYLRGYTSEKRDTNKSDLQHVVDSQEKEAIKHSLNPSISQYDRGVQWTSADVTKEGEKWLSAYLPVWLYSYVENPGTSKQLTHYVAVNARTRETIGSVPVNKKRITSCAFLAAVVMFFIMTIFALLSGTPIDSKALQINTLVSAIVAVIFYMVIYSQYRSSGARHHFEYETKIDLKNIQENDRFIKRFDTENSSFHAANNNSVYIEHL